MLVLIPGFLASICAVLCHIVSEPISKQLCTVFQFGKRSFACACTYVAHANISSSQYYGTYSIDGLGGWKVLISEHDLEQNTLNNLSKCCCLV